MTKTKWRACLGLALAATLCGSGAARAIIPGVPSLVYDPANHASAIARYAQLALQTRQQLREIQYAAEQARELKEQARGFRGFRLNSFDGYLGQAERAFGAGVGLGYGNSQLDRVFRESFPRTPMSVNGVSVRGAARMNLVRDLAYAALVSSRDQNQQLAAARGVIGRLRQATVSARTARQIEQAQGAIQAFQAEQDMMTRHALLSMNSQMAALNARQTQKEMEEGAREAAEIAERRQWSRAVAEWEREMRRRQREREGAVSEAARGRRGRG